MNADNQQLAPLEAGAGILDVAQVKKQTDMIQGLLKDVLKEDVHFGKIPGCGDTPALLQPGAQKIGLMFNLGPKYEIERTRLDLEHMEYSVICRLIHRSTSRIIGEGVGTCSTMESKYRFRWDDTGQEVPREYWQFRDKAIIGGDSYAARKTWVNKVQVWHVFQRVPHDNPADYYNTALKIAKKRAFNDAILTATAASDIFVPDDETDPGLMSGDNDAVAGATKDQGRKPPTEPQRRSDRQQQGGANTQSTPQPAGGGALVSEKQSKMIYAKLMNAGLTVQQLRDEFNVSGSDQVPANRVNDVLQWIESYDWGS